ncbi:hypothetical protein Tco_1380890 [Tanacetum coccineum]
MDVEEPTVNDVVNEANQPQDDGAPKQGKTDWFKQPPRPPTPDPVWNQDKSIDNGPEQTLLNDMVHSPLMNLWPLPLTSQHQLDWKNPKGDRCPYDLSKPLPLQGFPGHPTIPVNFFFNNDLEYLRTGHSKRKYTASIPKTKDARSQINRFSKHDVFSTMKILSMNKLFNLNGDEIVDLAVARRMFTRRTVIQKLNTTKPQKDFPGMSSKESYTTSYDPKRVVYLDLREHKRLMRAGELYKLSNGTLQSVRKILHYRLMNFKLGYNTDMPRRKWTNKDQNRTDITVQLIDKQLLEKRIMRNLERLVGGRELEMDYRLMQRTV